MNVFESIIRYVFVASMLARSVTNADEVEPGMTKMCLFYPVESGHARSDPILSQVCPADHVHTFYGPLNFHPNTSYQQLRDTKNQYTSSPWVENQSLYWHPSIYKVTQVNGQTTYTLVKGLDSSPYYRWNTSTSPETVEFPPGFRMIAYSTDVNAEAGGETGANLFMECCDFVGGGEGESCTNYEGNPIRFPTQRCDFLGIAFAMPTCWDESKGIGTNDPFNHVAYTTDGTVGGLCPVGYNKRIPQVQLFIRINNYGGGTHQLSDGSDIFHVDFMNGWQERKLQEIIDNCTPTGEPGYNPPCDCDQFLTENPNPVTQPVCESDIRQYIVNEEIDVVTSLPRGTCQGASLIPKSWDVDPPFQCSSNEPISTPIDSPTQTPTRSQTLSPTSTQGTPSPTAGDENEDEDDEFGDDEISTCVDSSLRFLVNGRGRTCDWVAQKNTSKRCAKGGGVVATHCPLTCGTCDEHDCTDAGKRFYLTNGKLKSCAWVSRSSTASRCAKEGVSLTCRATCTNSMCSAPAMLSKSLDCMDRKP